MRRLAAFIVAGCALLGGCHRFQDVRPPGDAGSDVPDGGEGELALRIDPLPVQQARAYPETATGIFASLADFEDVPGGEPGHTQVGNFSIRPEARGAARKFVVNVTRTGVGALEARLPAGSELVFDVPVMHDFTGYKLLSLAVYSRGLRDDLRVTLTADGVSWRSHRTLVRPGWNNVLIDIRRLSKLQGFDATWIDTIGVDFPDAADDVWVNLDDVMLIDNDRTIRPTPAGLVLRKSGLDYSLKLPSRTGEVGLRRGPDGLWRLERLAPQVRLIGPGGDGAAEGEDLALMGARRVGRVELLEHNRLRVRLANTWYFPARAGQWASLAVRKIRWEHTFYEDGRCVTAATLNNAGGREIASVGLRLPERAAWPDGKLAESRVLDFAGPVGRWQYLAAPSGSGGETVSSNYWRPGRLTRQIAAAGVFGPGDIGRDGFDESQGCFFLGARAGHCRFALEPPAEGVWRPIFVVAGRWEGKVYVGSEGLAIRDVVRRADGSIMFVLPGLIDRPTAVEITGRQALTLRN